MNANPEKQRLEEQEDKAPESEELVEVGEVSKQTKGSPFGVSHDNGGGFTFS